MRGVANALQDALKGSRDEEGRLVLGNPDKGCRHCGAVAINVAENDRLVWYHPAAECCPAAIADQIRFRDGEIATHKKAVAAKQLELDRLREEAEMYSSESRATEATRAHAALARAEEGFGKATGLLRANIRDALNEISRLQAKRAAMEVADA